METTTPAKKTLFTYCVFSVLIFVGMSSPVPSYAFSPVPGAPAPVFEIGPQLGNTGVSAAANTGSIVKEKVLDQLAFMVSRVAIHTMTKSVVNWINSGFNGSPAFVQDLSTEFSRIGDTVATRYIDEFTAQAGLQNLPWRDEIAQSVLGGYFQSTSKDGFYLQNPYTLDQVSSDPKAFVNGDYSKGGLAAWRELVFNPGANNPLLFRNALKESLNSRISGAQETRRTELNWNNGFNSFRGKCSKALPSFTGGTNVNTGSVLSFDGSSGSTGIGAPLKGAAPVNTGSAPIYTYGAGGSVVRPASVSLTNSDNCLGSPILTPGSLIAQSANKFLVDNGLDQLIQVDEINEVIGAVMNQLVNNVLGSGGLAGTSRPTSGGGSSYVDRLGNTTQTSGDSNSFNLSNSFLTVIATQSQSLQQYQENWQKIADAAASAKKAYPASSCITQVNSILAQAGTAISGAVSAISSIKKIQTDLTVSVSGDPTTQSETVATATTAYQALQVGGTFPTISEVTYAQNESIDRSANTDTGTSASLYTQMVKLQTTGTCPQ